MQRRKRSSSSLKSLPRLLPYLSVRLSHGLSPADLTLLVSNVAISDFSAIFFSPSSIFLETFSQSPMWVGPSRQNASE